MSVKVRNQTDYQKVLRCRSDGDETHIQPRAVVHVDDKYLPFIDNSNIKILQRPDGKSASVTGSTQNAPKKAASQKDSSPFSEKDLETAETDSVKKKK